MKVLARYIVENCCGCCRGGKRRGAANVCSGGGWIGGGAYAADVGDHDDDNDSVYFVEDRDDGEEEDLLIEDALDQRGDDATEGTYHRTVSPSEEEQHPEGGSGTTLPPAQRDARAPNGTAPTPSEALPPSILLDRSSNRGSSPASQLLSSAKRKLGFCSSASSSEKKTDEGEADGDVTMEQQLGEALLPSFAPSRDPGATRFDELDGDEASPNTRRRRSTVVERESERWRRAKENGFRDLGLYEHVDRCVQQRRVLRRVGDPDARRRERLLQLQRKNRPSAKSSAMMGLSPDDLCQLRRSLRRTSPRSVVDGDVTGLAGDADDMESTVPGDYENEGMSFWSPPTPSVADTSSSCS